MRKKKKLLTILLAVCLVAAMMPSMVFAANAKSDDIVVLYTNDVHCGIDDSIGYAGFLKVADDYSGTKAANLAKAYAGICYAQLGKYEDAVKMLDGFDGSDQMVAPAILGAAGNCYAQLGQLDKAASTLLSAADKADNNTLSPIFLIQAGEILVKQGKYDDAVNAYTKIKDKYFQSYQAMDIDKYIEQAKLMKK